MSFESGGFFFFLRMGHNTSSREHFSVALCQPHLCLDHHASAHAPGSPPEIAAYLKVVKGNSDPGEDAGHPPPLGFLGSSPRVHCVRDRLRDTAPDPRLLGCVHPDKRLPASKSGTRSNQLRNAGGAAPTGWVSERPRRKGALCLAPAGVQRPGDSPLARPCSVGAPRAALQPRPASQLPSGPAALGTPLHPEQPPAWQVTRRHFQFLPRPRPQGPCAAPQRGACRPGSCTAA